LLIDWMTVGPIHSLIDWRHWHWKSDVPSWQGIGISLACIGLYWIGLDWIGLLILSTGQLVGQDLHPSRGIAEQVPSSTLGIDSCASHAVE
jgi:hypothetical protein